MCGDTHEPAFERAPGFAGTVCPFFSCGDEPLQPLNQLLPRSNNGLHPLQALATFCLNSVSADLLKGLVWMAAGGCPNFELHLMLPEVA